MGDGTGTARPAPPIVELPEEIDATNSGQVTADIAAVCVPGVTTVIADLTSTTFCDSSAVRALVRAHKVAVSRGIELNLAVASDAVLRVFELTGLTAVLPIHHSLDEAIAAWQLSQHASA